MKMSAMQGEMEKALKAYSTRLVKLKKTFGLSR
jgi:hypothetical protein